MKYLTPQSYNLRSRFPAIAIAIAILLSMNSSRLALARPDDQPTRVDQISSLDQDPPCGFTHSKTANPIMVEVGQDTEIKVKFNYDCGRETTKANVMMTACKAVPPGFNRGVTLAENMRAGMNVLVDKIPFNQGSQAGMVVFDAMAFVRAPLTNNPADRQRLLNEIKTFRIGGDTCSSVNDAIFEAYKQLPTQIENTNNFIVLFDSGAPPNTACDASRATNVGVEIAVIQMPVAGGRWCPCSTMGCFTAADDVGSNLPELFEAVTDRIVRGTQINRVEVPEDLDTQLSEMVANSWSKAPFQQPPPAFLGYAWEYASNPHPPQGWELTYRVKIKDDGAIAPAKDVFYEQGGSFLLDTAGGGIERVVMDRPKLCIARPGQLQADCASWALTQTPAATATQVVTGTDTPTPIASLTPVPTVVTDTVTPIVTDTATEIPTETDDSTEPEIYLPILYREFEQ